LRDSALFPARDREHDAHHIMAGPVCALMPNPDKPEPNIPRRREGTAGVYGKLWDRLFYSLFFSRKGGGPG